MKANSSSAAEGTHSGHPILFLYKAFIKLTCIMLFTLCAVVIKLKQLLTKIVIIYE